MKITGQFGNYSEQQFLDCAYDHLGANACLGAPLYAYLNWTAEGKKQLANGKQYPYKGDDSPFDCPDPRPYDKKAAVVSSMYYTYNGTEELLKELVFDNDVVVVGVWFTEESWTAFQTYKKGIFSCPAKGKITGGHAMVAVGYGTEKGKDYWLLKNSFGPKWGEKGFMKLQRGNSSCGIGRAIVVAECEEPPKKKTTTKKKKVQAADCNSDYAACDEEEEYDEEEE
jgi:Papain family cysteine protease